MHLTTYRRVRTELKGLSSYGNASTAGDRQKLLVTVTQVRYEMKRTPDRVRGWALGGVGVRGWR